MQSGSRWLLCLTMFCPAAKNVILSGVKSVTLHDKSDIKLQDLSTQFYLTEADVGQNRAAACKDRLQELNISVLVSAASQELTESYLRQFQVLSDLLVGCRALLRLCRSLIALLAQVVVLTDHTLLEALAVDEICHKLNICFINANIRGVFAQVFCDFGTKFVVVDTDGDGQSCLLLLAKVFPTVERYSFSITGEEPTAGIIAGVTPGPPTLVTCVEDERLEFQAS